MYESLKIAVLILLLAASSACDKEIPAQNEDLEFFDFFNPFYLIPQSALNQSCVIDVKVDAMGEKEFIARIDRITNDTGNGIMYSNPLIRNRVAYLAPIKCGKLSQKGAYFPTKYFNQVFSYTKINASEHPYAVSSSEFAMKKLMADLKNAAVAVEFDFDRPTSEEVGKKKITDIFCVASENMKMQSRFGLPFIYILVWDHSILYLYNTYSIDTELVQYLVESGLGECGVSYGFQIRALNTTELNYASTIVVAPAVPSTRN